MIDILLLTYNRGTFLKTTIDELYKRTQSKFRLIVVDNHSNDETAELLNDYKNRDVVNHIITLDHLASICAAYDIGVQSVQTEYFIMMQDDVIVPHFYDIDWIERLVDEFNRIRNDGAIGCRIQHIPNLPPPSTGERVIPARKALSAYCRIQKKSDYILMGGLGNRYWDDLEFVKKMYSINKRCFWSNTLFVDHRGYMVENKGYRNREERKFSNSEARMNEWRHRPYPEIDPMTNVPLKWVSIVNSFDY